MRSKLDVGGQPPMSVEATETSEVLGPTPECPACDAQWSVEHDAQITKRIYTMMLDSRGQQLKQ
eukprot:5568067-Amphidinium_carterae.1